MFSLERRRRRDFTACSNGTGTGRKHQRWGSMRVHGKTVVNCLSRIFVIVALKQKVKRGDISACPVDLPRSVCVCVCIDEGGDGVSNLEGKESVGERGGNRSQMCAVKTYGF